MTGEASEPDLPDLAAYQRYVLSLEADRPLPQDRRFARLVHAALGMAGEVGELHDHLKKCLAYGKDLDADHLLEEMGDVLWYMTVAASALGSSLEGAMRRNRAKLEERFPSGFSPEDAVARRDEEQGAGTFQ